MRRSLPLCSDGHGLPPSIPRDRLLGHGSGLALHPPSARSTAPSPAPRERNVVQIADPAQPPKSRPSDRRQIRRNLEAGYELSLVPGAETDAAQRAGFLDVYEQTMRRAAAGDRYFFGAAYFDRVLEADAHLARPRRRAGR